MKFLNKGRHPTDFIADLMRDKGLMDLEQAPWHLSGCAAMAAGFTDRGFVVYPAAAAQPRLPANDWRLAQKAEGCRLTIVNGQVTFEDGVCTGTTPGALLRHGRTAGGVAPRIRSARSA